MKKALSAFCVLALVSGCSSTKVDAHGEVKKQAYTLKYINGDDSLQTKVKIIFIIKAIGKMES